MPPELLAGFLSGAALIIAIGAQNSFVLRQGLRREHVLPIVLVCAGADALLIAAGIAGLGALIQSVPFALEVTRYGGAAFLLAYGLVAARRALRPHLLTVDSGVGTSLGAAMATCLAFTFLIGQPVWQERTLGLRRRCCNGQLCLVFRPGLRGSPAWPALQ